jgi:SAM-dependent methyltransferase
LDSKRDITERFSSRLDAERYRDRFHHGKRRRTHQRESDALNRLLDQCGGISSVLDVGSGTGRFAGLFAKRACRVVQLDLAAHMLDVSRSSETPSDDRRLFVQGDIRRLPIADRSVDLVFCHRLLNHLTLSHDRRQALKELARACGRLLVVSTLGPFPPVRYVRDACDRWWGEPSNASRYVTPEALIRELAACSMLLIDRVAIRTFPASAAFLVFGRPASTTPQKLDPGVANQVFTAPGDPAPSAGTGLIAPL